MQDHDNDLTPPNLEASEEAESPSKESRSAEAARTKGRTASPAKVAANRRNAQRSTGPKTARGKAHSRRNALKHGFLAKELLIDGGEGKESRAQLAQFLQELNQYFQPVGLPEELLVQQIASGYWRLRRLYQHEVGEIRKRLDSASAGLTMDRIHLLQQQQFTLAFQRALATAEDEDEKRMREFQPAPAELEKIRQALLTSTPGIDFLLQILAEAHEEIASTGTAGNELLARLYLYFGFAEFGVAHFCALLTKGVRNPGDEPTESETPAVNTAAQQEALARIETEQNRLRLLREAVAMMEESMQAARLQSYRLPDPAALEQIVHYESHILRQLSRAYAHLERLQRLRAGEDLPLPLSARLELG